MTPTVSIAQHVAAITAAIFAATRGRGQVKILSVAPASNVAFSATNHQRWRAAAIVTSVGRRLAPSWKR